MCVQQPRMVSEDMIGPRCGARDCDRVKLSAGICWNIHKNGGHCRPRCVSRPGTRGQAQRGGGLDIKKLRELLWIRSRPQQ